MNADAMRRVGLIFRKEVRENAKWAGVVVVVLALVDAFVARSLAVQHLYYDQDDLLRIASPLFGFALGFLQIVPERPRDRWAYLIHRPATSEEILAGKALAGLCLIVVGLGIPSAGLARLASFPGSMVGPSDGRSFEFVVEIMGSAWCCELLSIASARSAAGWYGSKLMPVPVGIATAIVIADSAREGALVILCLPVALTVAFLAALSSFSETAAFPAGPTSRRFSLAAVLTVGIWLVGQNVMTIMTAVLTSEPHSNPNRWRTAEYSITGDGRVVVVTREYDHGGRIYSIVPVSRDQMAASENNNGNGSTIREADLIPMADSQARELFTPPWVWPNDGEYLDDGHDRSGDHVYWYLYQQVIIGYSSQDGRPVALIGKSGYRQIRSVGDIRAKDKLPGARMADRYGDPYIADNDSIYRPDYAHATIEPLYAGADAKSVRWIGLAKSRDLQGGPDADEIRNYVIVTPSRIHVLDVNLHEMYTIIVRTLPLAVHGKLEAGALDNGDLILMCQPTSYGGSGKALVHIMEFGTTGILVHDYTLLLPLAQNGIFAVGEESGIVAGTPLVDAFAVICQKIANPTDPPADLYNGIDLRSYAVGEALLILIGLLATWVIARRCALGRRETLAWMLGNAFVGWPGVFVMLAMRPLPARETCTACGRLRVVNRESCEHCGASWPQPKPDGTEIFDDAPLGIDALSARHLGLR